MSFDNMKKTGKLLAAKVREEMPDILLSPADWFIVALGKGGILIAEELAVALHSPLTIFAAETISPSGRPEIEIAAVSAAGLVVYTGEIDCLQTEQGYLGKQVRELSSRAKETIKRWFSAAGIGPRPSIRGKRAVVVADNVTSPMPAKVAAINLQQLGATKLILATPAISKETKMKVARSYDKVIALKTVTNIDSLRALYKFENEISDTDVVDALRRVAEMQKESGVLAGLDGPRD